MKYTFKQYLTIVAVILGGAVCGAASYLPMALRGILEAKFGLDETITFTNVFSYGVIAGVVIILLTTKLNHKLLVILLLTLSVVGTLGFCFSDNFALVVLFRVIAGMSFAPYFASAGYLLIDILGEQRKGQAMAFPTIGLNIANLLGIGPLTKLGEDLGDFVPPYLVIVGVTLLTIVLVVLTASSDTKPETVSIANELSALARPKIWFYTLLAALVFTCWFEIYWNVRIWWTQLNEMPGEWYAIFLIVLGVGLVAGSQIGGMLADRYRKLAIWIPVLGIILGVSVTAIFIHQPIMMLIGVFILGTFIQVICSPIVIQSMQSAPQAPMMSATMFQVGACSGVFMATFAYQFVNSTFGEVAYNPLYIDFALIPLVLVFATLSLIKSSLMKSRKNPAT